MLLEGELKGCTTMTITQLQCDINKKKYKNLIDIVNKLFILKYV